jgi:VanZ family protein
MFLKLAFAACLVLAHPRFLQNKGLVLIVLTSLLANVIISFLHGFVPVFLVSITDLIAALISGVLAAVWAVFLLVGAVISVVKAIV